MTEQAKRLHVQDPARLQKDSLAIQARKEETELMIFPCAVRLTLQDGSVLEFVKGPNSVPLSVLDHVYLKAHNIKKFEAPNRANDSKAMLEDAKKKKDLALKAQADAKKDAEDADAELKKLEDETKAAEAETERIKAETEKKRLEAESKVKAEAEKNNGGKPAGNQPASGKPAATSTK